MNTPNRVFVTGLSALTSCGETVDDTWNAVLEGRSGIEEITQWDISSWPSRLGGELKNFQPARMLPDRKLLKVISRQDVMGINAAMQAVIHSQMINYRDQLDCSKSFDENTAVYVGSPGNKFFQQYDFLPLLAKTDGDMQQFAGQLFNEVHPMWLLRILPNNVLAYTGITYGFKGPNHNVTNHAVGGTQAILEAYHAIKCGQAERAVVVAYDVGIEPQALFYYDKLGVVSAVHLKPFDKKHDGTILAEGAAAIILESEASARERSAICYGEIAGGFSASEAAGLFSLENSGESLSRLLQKTLDELQLAPADIDMIVAHGNGNKKSDESEAHAIRTVFSPDSTPVTAFKWATGHTLCASGVLDAVLTTCALKNQCIPGIATLDEVSSSCTGLNVSASHRSFQTRRSHNALMINRGFASMNACLVIKSCD
jgi:3-oxoacyl-[acyl-carrier-protein] synthase-1